MAVIYGCIVGAAISMYGYYDLLRVNDPGTYWALDRMTSFVPTLATMASGHPEIVRVIAPENCGPIEGVGSEYCSAIGMAGTYHIAHSDYRMANRPLEVDVISPRSGRWTLHATYYEFGKAPADSIRVVYDSDSTPRVM